MGGETAATSFLSILAEFASNLDRAVKKYDEHQKAEVSKNWAKKKPQPEAAKSSSKQKSQNEGAENKSFVLMVNEMLKIAGDKAKEDFMKGVTYNNPDSKLKQIYKMEHLGGSPSGSILQRDILHAIEEGRQLSGCHNAQAALSNLA